MLITNWRVAANSSDTNDDGDADDDEGENPNATATLQQLYSNFTATGKLLQELLHVKKHNK